MNRPKMFAAIFGSALLGLAALLRLAGHFATERQNEDEGR